MGILSQLQELRVSAAQPTPQAPFEVDGWATSAFVAHTLIPLVGVYPFPLQELMLVTATDDSEN